MSGGILAEDVQRQDMRRLLREVAAGNEVKGDTTTLEDFTVLAKLRETEE